jgi:hypothetical protein
MGIIIIPDVHGRPFWRKAVMDNPEDDYLFLGDYLDPYPFDEIDGREAFCGLEDILALWRKHPDKVTLLLGNHDLHYLHYELKGSRYDMLHAGRNAKFFRQHEEAFRLAYERTVGGQRFLFTHAGVGKKWIDGLVPEAPEELITAAFLNDCYRKVPAFINALADVSYYRGGARQYGSCVWADLQEQGELSNQLTSVVQVFGHTMVSRPFNYGNRIFCLDCRRCFRLDLESGDILDLNSGEPVPMQPMGDEL